MLFFCPASRNWQRHCQSKLNCSSTDTQITRNYFVKLVFTLAPPLHLSSFTSVGWLFLFIHIALCIFYAFYRYRYRYRNIFYIKLKCCKNCFFFSVISNHTDGCYKAFIYAIYYSRFDAMHVYFIWTLHIDFIWFFFPHFSWLRGWLHGPC